MAKFSNPIHKNTSVDVFFVQEESIDQSVTIPLAVVYYCHSILWSCILLGNCLQTGGVGLGRLAISETWLEEEVEKFIRLDP